MPHVWLNDDELSEFLNCPADEARHHAISAGWERQRGIDDVMRVRLPAREALRYVVHNARARFTPRDAALLEDTLRENAQLRLQLEAAERRLALLTEEVVSLREAETDFMVVSLRSLLPKSDGDRAEHEQQGRSVA